jgi:purine nucleosidase
MSRASRGCISCLVLILAWCTGWAQGTGHAPEKIIIDTDIGDDVDDAFALALAVKSPELQVLGLTTTFGDTEARARIADRFLGEVGRGDIPVLAGRATATKNPMSQRKYGEGGHFAKASHGDAVDFLLEQIRKYPGAANAQVCLDSNSEDFFRFYLKRVAGQ